ncbi:hypothetical protein ACFL6C_04240 [Myxococcota bacterium]
MPVQLTETYVKNDRVQINLADVAAVRLSSGRMMVPYCRITGRTGEKIEFSRDSFGRGRIAFTMEEEEDERHRHFSSLVEDLHHALLAKHPNPSAIRFTHGHKGGLILGLFFWVCAAVCVGLAVCAFVEKELFEALIATFVCLLGTLLSSMAGFSAVLTCRTRAYDPKTLFPQKEGQEYPDGDKVE